MTFLAIVGPGLIVMVGDNDAGGVSTYAQAGQNYGYSLLWVLLLLIPVLIVNQEMVVRLGAVTGVGHARLINERFGRFWGWFSVGDLFLLNFLTIVTEFIGVSLALRYFGVSPYISVPMAARAAGRHHRQRQLPPLGAGHVPVHRGQPGAVPLALLSAPALRASRPTTSWCRAIQGGVSSDAVLLIIAIVGTTVAPWQLFFQQSNVIDKRITPRFIRYERADTSLGAFVVVGRRRGDPGGGRLRGPRHRPGRALHQRARGRQRARRTRAGCSARCSRSCCWTPASSARRPSPCPPATRSATCSA